jgi:PTH1 family peptidyl-tRNA hydrolase
VSIKLIVGLGNPGRQYHGTRHNAGFWFLDGLSARRGGAWMAEARFQGLLSSVGGEGGKVLLLKPQTFMNRSGQSVGSLLRYYKFEPENIVVAHDELDLPVGAVKLKKGGGHAGHNGLRDIIAHIGSTAFYRLRIGISRPLPGMNVAEYVLSAPPKCDLARILAAVEAVYENFDLLVAGEFELLMNRLH